MATSSEKKVHFVKFNFDCTSLIVGFKRGIRTYCLKTGKPVDVDTLSEAVVIERLRDSSLLAFVTKPNLNRLHLHHVEKMRIIWQKQYPKNILSVQMNSEVMTVCLEDRIAIHDMRNMKIIYTINNIPEGCGQMSVLSSSITIGKCLFIYPCSNDTGNIRVFDILKKVDVTTIHAHENPIATMVMNRQQTLLATASTKGTVIRLISLPDGVRVNEFRRGMQSVETYSMTFSNDSKFLCCSSSSGTIHIFSLAQEEKSSRGWFSFLNNTIGSTADYMLSSNQDLTIREPEQDWMSFYSSKIISSAAFVPQTVYSQWNMVRSFATVRIPSKGMKCIGTLHSCKDDHVVVVASEDGYLYTFKFDQLRGGECKPLQTVNFTGELNAATSYMESILMFDDDKLSTSKKQNALR